MKRFLLIPFIFVLLAGCAPTPTRMPDLPDTATLLPFTFTPSPVSPTETPTTAPTAIPPTVGPSPTIELPTETPLLACVTLTYGENAQFEISVPEGPRVLVDVYDPTKLTGPAVASDILLTTHTHWDHYNEAFQNTFPGEQIFVRAGSLQQAGIQIQGLASSHNAGEKFQLEGSTNYIYIIDLVGLRIVHFGDIGQESLTEEQLAALGTVDIAITQLNNPYSEMNAENQKGIRLMEQLQPHLIIPTHVNLDTAKLAVARWPGWYSETLAVEICKSDLSADPQILFLGQAAQTMPRYLDLEMWE